MKVKRDWGSYRTIFNGESFRVKILDFDVGTPLSLQKHFCREELWLCLKGHGMMTVTSDEKRAWSNPQIFKAGDFAWINKERWHSYHAIEPTRVLEVQIHHPDEDDIVRIKQTDSYYKMLEGLKNDKI